MAKLRAGLGGLVTALLIAACSGQGGTGLAPSPTATPGTGTPTSSPAAATPTPASAPTDAPGFAAALAARGLVDLGLAPGGQLVTLTVTLNHQNQAALDTLIAAQRTPGSADYQHFLTPAQFDAQFGPSATVRSTIKSTFQSAGFTLLPDRFSASVFEVQGPVSLVQTYFSTAVHMVRDTSRNQTALTTGSPVVLPAAISTDVADVSGLDSADIRGPLAALPSLGGAQLVRRASSAPSLRHKNDIAFLPGVTYGPDNMIQADTNLLPAAGREGTDSAWYPGYGPYTVGWDADMPVQYGWQGDPQFPIALVSDSDFLDADVAKFQNDMILVHLGQTVRVGTGALNADQAETTLDVETLTALAPFADLNVYEINSFAPRDLIDGINNVIFDNKSAVADVGFSGCETSSWSGMTRAATAMDLAAAQGAAQGITFVTNTGNKGAHGCTSINAFAASPNVVAVGGLSVDSSGAAFAHAYDPPRTGTDPQPAWSASSGGTSTHFQTTEQLGACGQSAYRCVPDIALPADPTRGAYAVVNNVTVTLGGTEWAAAIFAAMQEEVDQVQGTRKGNVVGRLYSLYHTNGYNPLTLTGGTTTWPLFHDITLGEPGVQAAQGWDAASGIGTVDGYGLTIAE